MSHSYKILKADTEHDHVDQKENLVVTVQFLLGGKKHGEPRHFGFQIEADEREIRAELDRHVASLNQDAESAKRNAEYSAKHEKAQKTIKALQGAEPKKGIKKQS